MASPPELVPLVRLLESSQFNGHGIPSQHQRRRLACTGRVGDEDGIVPVPSLWMVTVAPGTELPCSSVTTPLIAALSERW
jgi:hypothetical protein